MHIITGETSVQYVRGGEDLADFHHHAWSKDDLQKLMHPEREQIMPRGVVLSHLDLRAGAHVADVGAGMGWLTFPLAVGVGSTGKVYAIDPSGEGIAEIHEKAQQERLEHIEAIQARAEQTPLDNNLVDRIVWHTMYHDVQDRQQALKEMVRILKSGGRWVIVDWDKRPMEMGPPEEVRVSPDTVVQEVEAVGMRLKDQWRAGSVTFGLTFEKP